MSSVEDIVCSITARFVGARSVTLDQRLHHDLHLGGDDVDELFEAVRQRFGTRFSGFSFQDYFFDEGDVWDGRFPRLLGKAPDKRAFTVRHLAAVVRRGEWFDP